MSTILEIKSSSLGIEVRHTDTKGRGVFATRPFYPGELIERCPVLIVPPDEWKFVEKSIFYNYLFSWGNAEEDQTALVLGLGSIYNHSYQPLAYYEKDFDNHLVNFIAHKLIQPGDEITINYNRDPTCQDPLWFHVLN